MDCVEQYAKHILVWHDGDDAYVSFPLYLNKENRLKGICVPEKTVKETANLYFKVDDLDDLDLDFGFFRRSKTSDSQSLRYCNGAEANCFIVSLK